MQNISANKMVVRSCFVYILFILNINADKFRFDNYTLYKIYPETRDHLNLLKNLHDNDRRYDFWSEPVPQAKFVNIMSPPEYKMDLEKYLNDNSFKVEVKMANVQEFVDKESVKRYTRRSGESIKTLQWDAYYGLDDINAWLDDVVESYPSIVTKIIGGQTFEGREIKGIKISHGTGKRAIFVEGGIHSREFIVPSFVTYLITQLLTSDDSETIAATRDFDWYIFPIINPDGYVWAHESYRLWRKNRRQFGEEVGVDLNRNWDNNWLVVGASDDPSSDHYAGPEPFSEVESKTFSEYIRSVSDQVDMYLCFHSFRQLLMVPFGNSTGQYANYQETVNIGRRAMGALSVRYGTEYFTGNIAEAIFLASGSSVDWVKEELKIPLVYAYELRDQGEYGFLLPTDQILPNNQEAMDSVIDLIHQGKRFGVLSGASGLQVSGLFLMSVIFVLTC